VAKSARSSGVAKRLIRPGQLGCGTPCAPRGGHACGAAVMQPARARRQTRCREEGGMSTVGVTAARLIRRRRWGPVAEEGDDEVQQLEEETGR
jgi:hypothetical protein